MPCWHEFFVSPAAFSGERQPGAWAGLWAHRVTVDDSASLTFWGPGAWAAVSPLAFTSPADLFHGPELQDLFSACGPGKKKKEDTSSAISCLVFGDGARAVKGASWKLWVQP